MENRLSELKSQAVKLRLQGIRPKQISVVLNSGHSPWVIRKWLRDAEVPSTQQRVIEASARMSIGEIASRLGISERRVQQILQRTEGARRQRNTPDQNARMFLSEPSRHMAARFTQSVPFGRALLKICVEEVSRAPIEGLRIAVEPTMCLFQRIWHTRRRQSTKRNALCLLVHSRGVEAHVYIAISRLQLALRKLESALEQADGCLACEADEFRRIGLLFAAWKRWDEAWSALKDAISRYSALANYGHDLHHNGLANCYLLKSILSFHTKSPGEGAAAARKGIAMITDKESFGLFGNLVYALTKCLGSSSVQVEVEAARELVSWCFDNLKMATEQSIPRTMLFWLRGFLSAMAGQNEEAFEYLSLALEDAKELELEQEVGSIIAQMGALRPDSREVVNVIEDVFEWDVKGKLLVPDWCRDFRSEISALYSAALASERPVDISLFSELHQAAKGEDIMPAFIVARSHGPKRIFIRDQEHSRMQFR